MAINLLLRVLGLLLADGAPTVGWGKTFWCVCVLLITSLLASCYEAHSITQVNISAMQRGLSAPRFPLPGS